MIRGTATAETAIIARRNGYSSKKLTKPAMVRSLPFTTLETTLRLA
jgi:hypothetical protein